MSDEIRMGQWQVDNPEKPHPAPLRPSEHTPGPWKVVSDPCHFHTMSDVIGGETRVRLRGGQHELHVSVGGFADVTEQEANARLIAASPDMLEVLESLVQWSESYPTDIFTEPTPEQIDEVCKASGFRLDRISAMVLRHFTKSWGDRARHVLDKVATHA